MLVVWEHAPLAGEVYNVATGAGHSTLDIAEATARAMGLSPAFEYTGSIRPGDSERWIASIDRIGQIGYVPRFELQQGIERTVAWYRAAACAQ